MEIAPTVLHHRSSAREIGTAGMMMSYTDPQIIADQIAALRALGLLGAAMPSIEEHNPVLAAAISSGRESFIDYELMREKPSEYHYEGVNGEGFIGTTKTWVARLHYELQTVALFSLMDLLESGTLQQEKIAHFGIALGDTTVEQNAFLAFNFNPDRQPREFFDVLKARLKSEGFGVEARGYNSFYKIPSFLWSGLSREQRERFAPELLSMDFNTRFEQQVLGRDFGMLLSSIFAWQSNLNARPVAEGESSRFSFDFGNRFAQGRIEFSDDGFLWTEELRGLASVSPSS